MYLLDTNTCIQFLNGKSHSVSDKLRMRTPSQLKLCSIVKAEMLYGAAKSTRPDRTRLLLEGLLFSPRIFPVR